MANVQRIEERLSKLRRQQDQLKAEIQRQSGRLAAQRRKKRTRALIVLGGALTAVAERGRLPAGMIGTVLEAVSDKDRELVEEFLPRQRPRPLPQAENQHTTGGRVQP